MAAHNKGKILRNGHYVKRRPYRPRIPVVSHGPWVSAETGRTYASEKQMKAAEKASKRMKDVWLLKKFYEKLPIDWGLLPDWLRKQDRENDTLLKRLFYKTGSDWEQLTEKRVNRYLEKHTLDKKDFDEKTLRMLITEIMDAPESETERQVKPIWLEEE